MKAAVAMPGTGGNDGNLRRPYCVQTLVKTDLPTAVPLAPWIPPHQPANVAAEVSRHDRFLTCDSGLLRAIPGYSGYFFEKSCPKTAGCARDVKARQSKSNQIKPNQSANPINRGQPATLARRPAGHSLGNGGSPADEADKLRVPVNVGKCRHFYGGEGACFSSFSSSFSEISSISDFFRHSDLGLRVCRTILPLLVLCAVCATARADNITNRLERTKSELTRSYSVPIEQWRFGQATDSQPAQTNFDDSSWQTVSPKFSWPREESNVWFRARAEVPAIIAGQSTENLPLRLDLGISGRCDLYIDGQLRQQFQRNGSQYTLTEHARPGQVFEVAINSTITGTNHQFNLARLYFNVLPELDEYIDDVVFVGLLTNHVSAEESPNLNHALEASENCIQFTNVTPDSLASVRAQIAKARAALAPVADVTRKYDVYYIGHAHIDMNWLWTWPETIDVCHRTWNTAMNLMQEFPDFHFVQSQPGAYVPIEAQYPEEFARMKEAVARGQWDPVGGLWDESDTDIPSGEGLARSFLLGQTYFKSHFGKYAVTGWLPDSFGHSWQLPQIMKLVGIRNFYHMRCGNGMEFTWWQAPDGSRVLKANTRSYDTRPQVDQLVKPLENEKQLGVPQSVVIFGVGDHGGGPTREMIMRIQSFQRDPIFPHVHFISADNFFDQLAKRPGADKFPLVDTDLQYVFDGCYTTHADSKRGIRSSENNLYSAEVLASLAAMTGQPYPVEGFQDAWKPTAFAQFHDIACGSAIHSTYEWMHDQFVPAVKFEHEQTDKSLAALNDDIDTRGPGDKAIVVWNTLSFPRTDVVRVNIPNAAQYHSVQDSRKHRFAAQAEDADTLVFIARDVPAFGHAVYFPATKTARPDRINLRDGADGCEIETPDLMLKISKTTGALTQLYSKTAKWNVVGNATDADALELLGDTGSAWDIKYTGDNKVLTTNGAAVSVLDKGPVFSRVRIDHAFGKSSYSQYVTVYGALPRIDVPTTVNWQEEQQLLKVRLPVNAPPAQLVVNAQIPYGSISRPAGRECPGQKWMDVSKTSSAKSPALYGLSVLNDSKYGFDVQDNIFRLTLLRSSQRPDPHPDQGEQKFTYSLYPHAGDWRAAHTDEQALALNIPLLAQTTTVHAPGKSIPNLSVENVGGQGDLIVTALKRSEDGQDYILRFYEADGRDTRARIVFDHPVRAQQVDILERPLDEQSLTTEGNAVTLPVGHNQIISVRFAVGS